MQLYINKQDSIPFYEQIYLQIRDAILEETVQKDELLPSMRVLAKDLRVSLITVKRAYEDLERDGYIYSVVGRGSYVKEQDFSQVKALFTENLKEQIEQLKDTAKKANISIEELIQMVKEENK